MSLWNTRKKMIFIGLAACVFIAVCAVFVFSNGTVASDELDGVWERRWEPILPADHFDERERTILERFQREARNHAGLVIRDISGNSTINTYYVEEFTTTHLSIHRPNIAGRFELVHEQSSEGATYRLYRVTTLQNFNISNDQMTIITVSGFTNVLPFSRTRNTITLTLIHPHTGDIVRVDSYTRSNRCPANRGVLDGIWESSAGGRYNRFAFFGGNFVQSNSNNDDIRRGTYNISNDLLEFVPENDTIEVVSFSRTENTLILQQQSGGGRINFTRVRLEEILARVAREQAEVVDLMISNFRTLQSASLMFFADFMDELQRDPAPATINGQAPDDIRNLIIYTANPESAEWGRYEFHMIGDGPLASRVW